MTGKPKKKGERRRKKSTNTRACKSFVLFLITSDIDPWVIFSSCHEEDLRHYEVVSRREGVRPFLSLSSDSLFSEDMGHALIIAVLSHSRTYSSSATLHTSLSPLASFRRSISNAFCARSNSVAPSTIFVLFGVMMPRSIKAGMISGWRYLAWNSFYVHCVSRAPVV